MDPALLVKLRPTGPWRTGSESGAHGEIDPVYHSDALYSAVCSAFLSLGTLSEWLDATARRPGDPAVRLSSLFPSVGGTPFVTPPRSAWPPMAGAPLHVPKVRWKAARFVPVELLPRILGGAVPDEDRWAVDAHSGCLVPAGQSGPYRAGVRFGAAVDRLSGAAEPHLTACLEFSPDAGFWFVAAFAGEGAETRWAGPLRAAVRLLADSGFGGERSRGWGRAREPEFTAGALSELLLPGLKRPPAADQQPATAPQLEQNRPAAEQHAAEQELGETPAPETVPDVPGLGDAGTTQAAESEPEAPPRPVEDASGTPPLDPADADQPKPYWLLSLFAPGASDAIDWKRGNYETVARGGRVQSPSGSGQPKKLVRMVAEGSVVYSARTPVGAAPDVAPEGFPHPVFRSGFALAVPIPEQAA
jgi:CRISPR type III-A-associated RAMP protein Csm4